MTENGSRQPTRRDFLKLGGGAFAGATVLGLMGCGGGGQDDAMRAAGWGEGTQIGVQEDLVEVYRRQHPDLTIKPEFSSFEGYFDRLATQTAGGNAPDLFQVNVYFFAEYAERGALLELDEFVPDTIDLSGVYEPVIESSRIEDALYAIPFGIVVMPGLLYDATVLREVGVEAPRDPEWTLEDFRRLSEEISEASGGEVRGTADLGGSHPHLEAFLSSEGKDMFASGGRLGFRREDLTNWFTYWDDMRRSGACVPTEVTASVTGFQNSPIITGDAAIYGATTTKDIVSLQPLTENDLVLAPTFPRNTPDSESGTIAGATGWWGISADTEYPEQAAGFIDFFLRNREAVRTLGMGKAIPMFPELRGEVEWDETERAIIDNLDFVLENSPRTLRRPYPAGAGELIEGLDRINEQIGFGEVSIEQGVDDFFSEAERLL